MGVYKQRDLDLNPRNFPALIKSPLHIEIDYKNALTIFISFLEKKRSVVLSRNLWFVIVIEW